MQMFDGDRHCAQDDGDESFDLAAIGGYLPRPRGALVGRTMARLAAGSGQREGGPGGLRKLAIEVFSVICHERLGLPPGPETDAVCAGLRASFSREWSRFPVPFHGKRYARACAAARDLWSSRAYRWIVVERRDGAGKERACRALLGAKADNGHVFTDDEAVLEVHQCDRPASSYTPPCPR